MLTDEKPSVSRMRKICTSGLMREEGLGNSSSSTRLFFFPAFHLDFRELNAVAIGDIKWCKEIKFLESERLEMDHVDLLTTDWAKKTVLDPLGN